MNKPEKPADLIRRAKEIVRTGELELALKMLQDAITQYPRNTGLTALKISLLTRLGRMNQAASLTRSFPSELISGQLLKVVVENYLRNDEPRQARFLLDDFFSREGPTFHFLITKCRYLQIEEGPLAALDFLREHGEAVRKSPPLLREQARILTRLGRIQDAMKILAIEPDDFENIPHQLALIRLEIDAGLTAEAEARLLRTRSKGEMVPLWHLRAIEVAEKTSGAQVAVLRALDGLSNFPMHTGIRLKYQRLLVETGQIHAAVSDALAFSRDCTEDLDALIGLARLLDRLGEEEHADRILEDCLELDRSGHKARLLKAEILLRRSDPLSALSILNGLDQRSHESVAVIQLFSRVNDALGDWRSSITCKQKVLDLGPWDPIAVLSLCNTLISVGDFDEARIHLTSLSPLRGALEVKRNILLADIASFSGQYVEALRAVETALETEPHSIPALTRKSEYQLFLGDLVASIDTNKEVTKLKVKSEHRSGASGKERNSVQGQILNEFRLLAERELLPLCASDQDQSVARQEFRRAIEANPGNTAHALALFGALHRTGEISTSYRSAAKSEATQIPRIVTQFWDTLDVPEQVAWVAQVNVDLNPEYQFQRFNEASALTFFRERGEESALRAFRLAPHPAAKADIFRLAYLWHEGGVYLDADDRCVAPLSKFLDHTLRFIGYQEPPRSIGNNFIAVRKHDPIIRVALDDVQESFSQSSGESLWLATGPGAITRAVAAKGTNSRGHLEDGIWIMPMYHLRRNVAPHIRLSYKSTERHWSKLFQRTTK